MRILLTGGAGFTGRHFAAYAEEYGHEVISPQIDLTDPAQLAAVIGPLDFDAVAHFAAISFVGHASATQFYDVNTVGTLNLLDALLARGQSIHRVLLASSANIYGNSTVSPIKESQAPVPVNHYAASKLAMEHLARTYADRLPVFFVRPFNYTGPGQADSFLIPKLVAHFVRQDETIRLGNLDVAREFNDVRFVCEAYLRLFEAASIGDSYNICTGKTWLLGEVIDILSELTGHSIQVQVDPNLVRANEIKLLSGDPGKLIATVGALPSPTLAQTLSAMIRYGCLQ